MKKVNHYSCEVKYRGDFKDHSKREFYDMAQLKMAQGVDVFDCCSEYEEDIADDMDGVINVENTYPSNNIAIVSWSFIDEE